MKIRNTGKEIHRITQSSGYDGIVIVPKECVFEFKSDEYSRDTYQVDVDIPGVPWGISYDMKRSPEYPTIN